MIRRRGKTTNKGWFGRRARNTNRQASRPRSLRLEPLEQRTLLSAVTVTDGGDAGLGTLRAAIEAANGDSSIDAIVIDGVAAIEISSPLEYTGGQSLSIDGGETTIEPEAGSEGDFDLLISSGGASLSLSNMTVQDGAIGIFVPVPADAKGVVSVSLMNVDVIDNKLFGLFVDDQTNNSDASIHLDVADSSFTGNGTGGSDNDALRVDEGGLGNIVANVADSHFDNNGGDGFELDERGDGSITLNVARSTFDDNGDFDPDDLEDGMDLDEAGAGSLHVTIVDSTFNGNFDEGLDLDEEQEGNVWVSLLRVDANDNGDEGIKINEKFDDDDISSAGNLFVSLVDVEASRSKNQEGIQITEKGAGNLTAILQDVTANNNDKEGIELAEEGAGNFTAILQDVTANDNKKEGIELVEEGTGNMRVILRDVVANGNDDDGIQIEEADGGNLSVLAVNVTATNNDKFGLKVEQKGAGSGRLRLQSVTLEDNVKDGLDTDGVTVSGG